MRLPATFKPAFLIIRSIYSFLAGMDAFLCHLSMHPRAARKLGGFRFR